MKYIDVLNKAHEIGYWNLSEEEREIIRKYDRRERKHRAYPTGGNSETIMRNRILRAESFGLTRDNIYK